MKEKLENWKDLSDAEKARLVARVPIANDDPTAISTATGWAAYQEHRVGEIARYEAEQKEAARLARIEKDGEE